MFGQPMNRGNRIAVLRQVGSLIESPSYYGHLTGEENLRIVQTLRGLPPKAIREVLEIVRLEGQRGKKVCHYSLGMKQRLGIATALLGYPKLLILDEPTNGLDPAGIQEMRELIRDLPSRFGMTVVVSATCSVRSTRWPTPWASSGRGVLVFQDTLAALHGRSRHHLALRTTNNALAAQVLREKGIGWTEEGDYLVLPILPDEQAAGLCRALVEGRLGLVRLEERQKSLEDIFLELTGERK